MEEEYNLYLYFTRTDEQIFSSPVVSEEGKSENTKHVVFAFWVSIPSTTMHSDSEPYRR
jgi:hypothetical protein